MNCPSCRVGLKIAGHRGVSVNYCPLCGGTWLDQGAFDGLRSARPTAQHLRPPRRLVRIAVLTGLILAGCLVAAISVGAIKLRPTVRGWADALLAGKEIPLAQDVRELATRLNDPRLGRLSQIGLDNAAISTLIGNSRFEPLLRSVAAVPELGPLLKDGTCLKVLEEAGRQNVQNLLDLKTEEIVAVDVRRGAERIQQLLRSVSGAEAIGAVDPAVVGLLRSEAFQQLCKFGFFESDVRRADSADE